MLSSGMAPGSTPRAASSTIPPASPAAAAHGLAAILPAGMKRIHRVGWRAI